MKKSEKDRESHEKDSEREFERAKRGTSERVRRENKLINIKKVALLS